VHPVGVRAPISGPIAHPQVRRDAREAIAPGPAHHARERVDTHLAAQLPDPGIGLIEENRSLLAERLEAREEGVVSAAHQPPIEEKVRRREYRRSVDIMLDLPVRLIADSNRSHSAITRETFRDVFVLDRAAVDPV
jgi:hypothetical protein